MILFVLLFNSCSRERDISSQKQIVENKNIAAIAPFKKEAVVVEHSNTKINIYIENSFSMDGYLPNPRVRETKFRDVLRKLLIYSKNEYSESIATVSLINNEKTYVTDLNSSNISLLNENAINSRYAFGRQNSDFDRIIAEVIEAHGDDDVSILVADFIYSPAGNDFVSGLNKLQDNITDALLSAKKSGKEISINIYRFLSDFDGIYYDYNNQHLTGIKERPFFLFVIANRNNLMEFQDKVEPNLTSESNFTNSYYFINEAHPIETYSVLLNTLSRGSFVSGSRSGNDKIKAIKYDPQRRGVNGYQVAIAVNLSDILASEDYLLDKNNYYLENKDYSLSKIGIIDQGKIIFDNEEININPSDIIRAEESTHILVFTSDKPTLGDLSIELKKNLPNWISEVSTDDDRDIQVNPESQLKTLGFKYIAQGIFQANNEIGNNSNYFKIVVPFEIKTANGWSSKVIILISILVFGMILTTVYFKHKSRK